MTKIKKIDQAFWALILLVAVTETAAAAQSARRLRTKEASITEIKKGRSVIEPDTTSNGRRARKSLLRVEDIHSSRRAQQHKQQPSERELEKRLVDLEDEILWETFLMGRQGGSLSFVPVPTPTSNAATPPPSESPTPAPKTHTPTQAPISSTPTPAPETETPTQAPISSSPTPAAETETPTQAPTTEAPTTEAPTTETPTQLPTTKMPTVAPTLATPLPTIRFVTTPPTLIPTTPVPTITTIPPTPTLIPTVALVTPSPMTTIAPRFCGCFDCTEEVWDTIAGGFTCGERIVFIIGMGSTEEEACSIVSGTEFPTECGACNPATCDEEERANGDAPTATPRLPAGTESPANQAIDSAAFCGCDKCTDEVWNTRSGLFTCGELILSVQDVSSEQACRIIGAPDSEFADECSPCACGAIPVLDADVSTPASTDKPSSEPTKTTTPSSTPVPNETQTRNPSNSTTSTPTSVPNPEITPILTRCGCSSCGASSLANMAGDFSCGDRIEFLMSTGELEEDACRIVAGIEFSEECGNCDPDNCQEFTEAPSEINTTSTVTLSPKCGCNDCEAASYRLAGDSTCGDHIDFLMQQGSTEEEACHRVAHGEFPFICGPACDPTRCDGREFALDAQTPIYCFPAYDQRQRYENVWGDYILEVKEDELLGVCGPSFNKFTRNTVSVQDDELTLQYKKNGDMWEGSEVRVVLPDDKMPFQYGTYSWNVRSIQVKNVKTGVVRQDYLPPSLVLGMFTWDATEDFTVRENFNNEVNVELGRLGDPSSETDGQFLVQPVGEPNRHRFSTKNENGDFQQAPQEYSFTWNPAEIAWETTAGVEGADHSYTTEQAITLGLDDFVQCPSTNLEIRINLWNLKGTLIAPMEMNDDEMVEVIIDNFTYTPTNRTGVEDGDFCSRNCQCMEGSECSLANNRCTPTAAVDGVSGGDKL